MAALIAAGISVSAQTPDGPVKDAPQEAKAAAKKGPAQLVTLKEALQDSTDREPKLVRSVSLNSVQANREFDRNVRIMQQQRQLVQRIQAQIDEEESERKRAKLEKELATALQKLNDNNTTMVKTYGYSLNRRYVRVIQTSEIYMYVTDEEAERMQAKAETGEKLKKAN
jgi:hypothetical protein